MGSALRKTDDPRDNRGRLLTKYEIEDENEDDDEDDWGEGGSEKLLGWHKTVFSFSAGQSLLLKLNEPTAESSGRCFRAAQDIEFRENAAQVALDSCLANEKIGPDFLVAPPSH
jgi:hypothetical protein